MRRQVAPSNVALTAGLLLTLLAACLLLTASPSYAKTFTVNTKADSADQKPGDGKCFTGQSFALIGPECTLRAAMVEANKFPGADTIGFNIGLFGTGLQTIEVGKTGNGALPTITKAVTIDGYTESGATKNTIPLAKDGTNAVLEIEFDGTNAGSSHGLEIDASNVVVRGLVINSFSLSGIRLSSGTGHKIEGNFIGTDAGGGSELGNTLGVYLDNTTGSTIGGTSPEARNIISGNSDDGVLVSNSSGNKIQGNLIGTDKNGTAPLGNDSWGMFVSFSSKNTIGDSDPTDGPTNAANTIAFNSLDGVAVGSESTGNRILSNSIFANDWLGIDLRPTGVTDNDPKDPDTGSNRLQNFPVLSAQESNFGNSTIIGGDLNSTPSTRKKKRIFIIQFFSNPSTDPNEGKTFLHQMQVKTDRQGNALDFGFEVSQAVVSEGDYITATATNKATGDTSEFSEARVVEGPVIGE
jgi:parallel beta-helix repeat protein